MKQYAALDDTIYLWFASNDTSGSGGDGASAAADVRLAGAAADAAPVYSPTPALLTHVNYPAGSYEIAITASAANGFATGNTYAVFCTLAIDAQNPTGFVGSFDLKPVESDITHLGGDAQSGTDLKAFADQGYDPATNKISGVVLTDTCTTTTTATNLTNAPTAGGLTATMKLNVNTEVGTALSDIKLDHLVAVADADDAVNNSIIAKLAASDGDWSGFDNTTDSFEAIRDRGDAAWTTGAGGSDRLLMVDTTIATLSSQTSFTLTSGSADDDAYNNCTIVIEDASSATQKAVGIISDYVGATKTVTLKYDPAIFTITTTDKVYILAENALKATLANRQLNVAADGDIAGNIDGSVASVVGHTAQTGDSFARLGAAGVGLTDLGGMSTGMKAEVESEANDALVAQKLDHLVAVADADDVVDSSIIAKLASKGATPDWSTFVNTTDSFEAIRDRGDAEWMTATGFSTHSAADIWSVATRALTDKSGFALSATGANLILKDSTFALAMADAIWDEILSGATHNIAGSAGRRVREIGAYAIESGTAQAGSSNSITLAATASAIDGTYNRNLVVLTDNTGVGQTRTIVDYDGATKVAVIDRDWRTSPDATTTYQVTADNTPLVVDQGVAQSGTSTTIKLRAYASSTNDIYLCNVVAIIAGTGRGQARLVGSYDGTSKVATICGDNWVTNPDNTSVYVLMPYGTTCTSCIGTYALGLINTECDTALSDYGANTTVPDAAGVAATPAEVATALSDIHLDHLLAVNYDPASKPGVATALLNELVENDGGVSRYTANALEQAPSGGTNPNVLIDTTIAGVTDQTHFTLTAGSDIDDAYKDQTIVVYDASNNDYPSVRKVSAYTGATKTVTLDSAADFTIVNGDGVKTFVTAPRTTAPTVGQIRAEMEGVGYFLDLIKADTNELQTDWVNGGRLDNLLDAIPTTAMRGTDSATLAVTWTDARAAYLDNLSAGAVALASGVDLTSIHGAALTETVDGYLAAAFTKLFDVATPLLVSSEVMRGTDGANTTVPDAAGTAAGLIATLNDISVANIIAGITDGALDLQEMMRIILAFCACKSSGGGTATIKFRDYGDAKDRITATVDITGNRTAIALDGS